VTAPLVQIRGLTKAYYGQRVLSDVSFDIQEGEVFGYIGPNGAGKTATLKVLAGLITQYQGQVTIDGADIAKDRARRPSPDRLPPAGRRVSGVAHGRERARLAGRAVGSCGQTRTWQAR
jgi:ABC-type Fe3+/spermidine/putrescine transport system ATPase subunit